MINILKMDIWHGLHIQPGLHVFDGQHGLKRQKIVITVHKSNMEYKAIGKIVPRMKKVKMVTKTTKITKVNIVIMFTFTVVDIGMRSTRPTRLIWFTR